MKDFNLWNKRKISIQNKDSSRIFFKEREVWWCSIGLNIGSEEDGKGDSWLRPVLVLRKINRNTFIGIPLSTHSKNNPYTIGFSFIRGKESLALINQVRLCDVKRMTQRIGMILPDHFHAIQKATRDLFL